MFENVSPIVEELKLSSIAKQDAYCIGKLLFSSSRKSDGLWLNITLQESESFIQKRLNKYKDTKMQARMFFPDELMQYFAWKVDMK